MHNTFCYDDRRLLHYFALCYATCIMWRYKQVNQLLSHNGRPRNSVLNHRSLHLTLPVSFMKSPMVQRKITKQALKDDMRHRLRGRKGGQAWL